MGDLSETFLQGEASREEWATLHHKTARGAMLLQWLGEQDMQAPSQDIATPTYNHLHQPRRLDYVFLGGIQERGRGRVHQLRHLASSDRDAVTVCVQAGAVQEVMPQSPQALHGVRQLKEEPVVRQASQTPDGI